MGISEVPDYMVGKRGGVGGKMGEVSDCVKKKNGWSEYKLTINPTTKAINTFYGNGSKMCVRPKSTIYILVGKLLWILSN